MLTIIVPEHEEYDDDRDLFITVKATTLKLEHSLVSISKWESKWHKPFAVKEKRTVEETIDYIRCMTLNDVDDATYMRLVRYPDLLKSINDYIDDPMTATTFNERGGKQAPKREIITAEIVYYWMVSNGIPFECQYWHLNKLLALIKVCNIKNTPQKKMSASEIAAQNRLLNEARRKKWNSHG